jgi:hypothetical protein
MIYKHARMRAAVFDHILYTVCYIIIYYIETLGSQI